MMMPEIVGEAITWLGTPYIPRARRRGEGVDCANLVAAVYQSVGLIGDVEFPDYTMDGGTHIDEDIIEPIILSAGFRVVDGQSQPGDLLSFRLGRVPWHLGIQITDELFIHAIRDYGVIESHLHDSTYIKRLTKVYRII